MVFIKTKILKSIPHYCPNCNGKLHHVNALDTKAQLYMVFCLNTNGKGKLVCKYCQEWRKGELEIWV